ncbi:MAG: glycosyl hydrolase [Flavobacteriales bacterium]|nr:glycosyl hydrolase [Flavobacteriales bacterium]
MIRPILTLLTLLILTTSTGQVEPTEGDLRLREADKRQSLIESSTLKGISFVSVGPTVMSGRVVDLAVNPADPTHFFVAYASGGLWETRNNGHSFEPLFDDQAVMTIGAIGVDWKDTTIWVGTGEVNSSRSSYSGLGVFRSSDHGASWQHVGLADSHHIGKIIVHPEDGNKVWVAALGPLYSDGGQRGVFMSSDSGEKWSHVLDLDVGAVDLALHPDDPDKLYAALWDRHREAWDFRGNGRLSGIYESVDGGQNWSHLSGTESGFPQGETVGRIGLDVTSADGMTYLYATHDNQDRRPSEEDDDSAALDRSAFEDMTIEEFMALDQEEVVDFLKDNKFPEKYTYELIRQQIIDGEIAPRALYDYLSDANTDLFDTPVIGAEVYRYNFDQGTWNRTHEGYLDDLVYSYGYYFGMIHIQPGDGDWVYIGGVPLLFSSDGGATWKNINPENVHADHHALWLDPERPGHLINGNDGGLNISYDNGAHYVNCNSPAVGQFYTVQVDNEEEYIVYGGLQDNGVWKGPHDYEASAQWLQTGNYPYEQLMGGDGMQIEVEPGADGAVYTGYQFGHYYRLQFREKPLYFHPEHDLGEKPLRWNWQTPIHLSTHNPDILYMGSNKVHRSLDRAENFETISPDLTYGGKEGNVPFGTLTSIHESPLQFGLIVVGSDDGRVHLSSDGGAEWIDIGQGLVDSLWVTRVCASHHNKDRLYVSLNGYRQDHMDAYVYRSDDQGKTWNRIGEDLPKEPVNVILEDPMDEDLIYVGTDHGLYTSMDGGKSFQAMMSGLPHVPVHDMVIQKRENDLVIGTHGRSIYRADIEKLRELKGLDRDLHLFALDTVTGADRWGKAAWSKWFGVNEPELDIFFYETSTENCTLDIESEKGKTLNSLSIPEGQGLQSVIYDMSIADDAVEVLTKELRKKGQALPEQGENGVNYLPAGTYRLKLSCGTESAMEELIIK